MKAVAIAFILGIVSASKIQIDDHPQYIECQGSRTPLMVTNGLGYSLATCRLQGENQHDVASINNNGKKDANLTLSKEELFIQTLVKLGINSYDMKNMRLFEDKLAIKVPKPIDPFDKEATKNLIAGLDASKKLAFFKKLKLNVALREVDNPVSPKKIQDENATTAMDDVLATELAKRFSGSDGMMLVASKQTDVGERVYESISGPMFFFNKPNADGPPSNNLADDENINLKDFRKYFAGMSLEEDGKYMINETPDMEAPDAPPEDVPLPSPTVVAPVKKPTGTPSVKKPTGKDEPKVPSWSDGLDMNSNLKIKLAIRKAKEALKKAKEAAKKAEKTTTEADKQEAVKLAEVAKKAREEAVKMANEADVTIPDTEFKINDAAKPVKGDAGADTTTPTTITLKHVTTSSGSSITSTPLSKPTEILSTVVLPSYLISEKSEDKSKKKKEEDEWSD